MISNGDSDVDFDGHAKADLEVGSNFSILVAEGSKSAHLGEFVG